MRHKLYLEGSSKSTRALSTRLAQNEREIQVLDVRIACFDGRLVFTKCLGSAKYVMEQRDHKRLARSECTASLRVS